MQPGDKVPSRRGLGLPIGTFAPVVGPKVPSPGVPRTPTMDLSYPLTRKGNRKCNERYLTQSQLLVELSW